MPIYGSIDIKRNQQPLIDFSQDNVQGNKYQKIKLSKYKKFIDQSEIFKLV
jgi:hypothetical protein